MLIQDHVLEMQSANIRRYAVDGLIFDPKRIATDKECIQTTEQTIAILADVCSPPDALNAIFVVHQMLHLFTNGSKIPKHHCIFGGTNTRNEDILLYPIAIIKRNGDNII